MDHQLHIGHVMHRRPGRPSYGFSYPVFSVLINLRHLQQANQASPLFSIDRWNLLSLRQRDHGARDGSELLGWAERQLHRQGIDLQGGPVLLHAFPRLLGFAFNPLTVWYCLHRDGRPRAIICEVSNTFGEHHHYLLHDSGRPLHWPVRDCMAKVFHVSPFMPLAGQYRFRLSQPGRQLSISVQLFRDGQRQLAAVQRSEATALTSGNILRALARTPLMTLKVVAAIHWQALKLWLRGARFHRKPAPPIEEIST